MDKTKEFILKTITNKTEHIDTRELYDIIREGKAENIEEIKKFIEELEEMYNKEEYKFGRDIIRNTYYGEYVFDKFNEYNNIPENVIGYIDYDKVERDTDYLIVDFNGVEYYILPQ